MNEPAHAAEFQVVCLELAGETYAVDIARVQEIIRLQEITPIPRAPEFIEGIINLRGRIIPVLDLRKRLGLPAQTPSRDSRIAIVEIAAHTVGVVVDAVTRVLWIMRDAVEPPSPLVAGVNTEYVRGIAKLGDRLVVLLDLDRVLSLEENAELGSVPSTPLGG